MERERAARNLTFAELEENDQDLGKLESWLNKVRARDHFRAAGADAAREAVDACRTDLETFAEAVYAVADHGQAETSTAPDEDPSTFEEGNWQP